MKTAPKTRATTTRRNEANRRRYRQARWRSLRPQVLKRDNYLCQECKRKNRLTPGNEVDHVVPAERRPDLFYDIDNLQTLCSTCHSRKTYRGE